MIVSGTEYPSKGPFTTRPGPVQRSGRKGDIIFPSPIGKPRGNGIPPRAFRSPGVGYSYSAPGFWERKGTEKGTE